MAEQKNKKLNDSIKKYIEISKQAEGKSRHELLILANKYQTEKEWEANYQKYISNKNNDLTIEQYKLVMIGGTTEQQLVPKSLVREIHSLAEIDAEKKNNNRFIIWFSAPKCGPCIKVSPRVDELSADNNIVVLKINAEMDTWDDILPEPLMLPTFQLFRSGGRVRSISGKEVATELESLFTNSDSFSS